MLLTRLKFASESLLAPNQIVRTHAHKSGAAVAVKEQVLVAGMTCKVVMVTTVSLQAWIHAACATALIDDVILASARVAAHLVHAFATVFARIACTIVDLFRATIAHETLRTIAFKRVVWQ